MRLRIAEDTRLLLGPAAAAAHDDRDDTGAAAPADCNSPSVEAALGTMDARVSASDTGDHMSDERTALIAPVALSDVSLAAAASPATAVQAGGDERAGLLHAHEDASANAVGTAGGYVVAYAGTASAASAIGAVASAGVGAPPPSPTYRGVRGPTGADGPLGLRSPMMYRQGTPTL